MTGPDRPQADEKSSRESALPPAGAQTTDEESGPKGSEAEGGASSAAQDALTPPPPPTPCKRPPLPSPPSLRENPHSAEQPNRPQGPLPFGSPSQQMPQASGMPPQAASFAGSAQPVWLRQQPPWPQPDPFGQAPFYGYAAPRPPAPPIQSKKRRVWPWVLLGFLLSLLLLVGGCVGCLTYSAMMDAAGDLSKRAADERHLYPKAVRADTRDPEGGCRLEASPSETAAAMPGPQPGAARPAPGSAASDAPIASPNLRPSAEQSQTEAERPRTLAAVPPAP